jgi:hypothetical protein
VRPPAAIAIAINLPAPDPIIQAARSHQEQELRRVLADGRLPLDNTRAERSLRKIVVGRKNWMFYGSNSHAESAHSPNLGAHGRHSSRVT